MWFDGLQPEDGEHRKCTDVSCQTCCTRLLIWNLAKDQEGGKMMCLAAREDGIKYTESVAFLEHTVFLDTILSL